jgi:hypothetical protein
MNPGKAIEDVFRTFRSYLLPSHYQATVEMKQRAVPPPADRPTVLFDFKSIAIDRRSGRYLYHLIDDCESAGYAVAYSPHHRFLGTFRHKPYKHLLAGHAFSLVDGPAELPECAAWFADRNILDGASLPPDCKRVLVDYTERRARPGADDEFEITFGVHPKIRERDRKQSSKKPDLEEPRSLRLFFAGNTRNSRYGSETLADRYRILSRERILAVLAEALPAARFHEPRSADAFFGPPPAQPGFHLARRGDVDISFERWLEAMSRADFFLGCPGVEMPLCHNLVEALRCGTVPILQYHRYLNPPLKPGRECLVFEDEESLVSAVERALAMPTAQILAMRRRARAYYESHLEPGIFTRKLMDGPNSQVRLLLNAYREPR